MRVILTDDAEADLAEIYAHYAERSGPTADRVVGTIFRAINGLASFPLMGRPGEVPETRERLVTHYPYRIIYHIDQRREIVEIWRVIRSTQRWPPRD